MQNIFLIKFLYLFQWELTTWSRMIALCLSLACVEVTIWTCSINHAGNNWKWTIVSFLLHAWWYVILIKGYSVGSKGYCKSWSNHTVLNSEVYGIIRIFHAFQRGKPRKERKSFKSSGSYTSSCWLNQLPGMEGLGLRLGHNCRVSRERVLDPHGP